MHVQDELEELITGENAVTPSPNQAWETLDPNDAPVSISYEELIESQNMPVVMMMLTTMMME